MTQKEWLNEIQYSIINEIMGHIVDYFNTLIKRDPKLFDKWVESRLLIEEGASHSWVTPSSSSSEDGDTTKEVAIEVVAFAEDADEDSPVYVGGLGLINGMLMYLSKKMFTTGECWSLIVSYSGTTEGEMLPSRVYFKGRKQPITPQRSVLTVE